MEFANAPNHLKAHSADSPFFYVMIQNKFTFCPQCGKQNIQTLKGGRKWLCPDCGFELFHNVASAVGLIILNKDGQMLFERRAKDPRKGFLAFPGGFIECDETAEDGALRECEEEIGVRPISVGYVCSFPNTYEYNGIVYKTCDMFFEAVLPKDCVLHAQESEVSAFEWRSVRSAEDIDSLPLAFESARRTLHFWLEKK